MTVCVGIFCYSCEELGVVVNLELDTGVLYRLAFAVLDIEVDRCNRRIVGGEVDFCEVACAQHHLLRSVIVAESACVHEHCSRSRSVEPTEVKHWFWFAGAEEVPLAVCPGLYPGVVVVGVSPTRCVHLACRYAYGSERCNGKRTLLTTTSGCGLERCERRRCAGVRRLVCHLLVAPVVHLDDGVHHRHAFDAILQFVVEHRACIVQSLVVDTDRHNEVAEKQFGNVLAPRHLLASLE